MVELVQKWWGARVGVPASAGPLIEVSSQKAALAALKELIERRAGVILLEAPSGMGKTELLIRFQDVCDVAGIFSLMFRRPDFTLARLQAAVAQRLVGPFKAAPNMSEIETLLAERRQRGWSMVLLIDEAERLSTAAWRALGAFAALGGRDTPALTIVLSGRPPLGALLGRPKAEAVRARTTARIALPPLSAAEAADFIRQWLMQQAHLRPEAVLSPDAMPALAAACEGVPARLIALMTAVRDAGVAAGARPIDRTAVDRVVRQTCRRLSRHSAGRSAIVRAGWRAAGVVAALVLVGALFWGDWDGGQEQTGRGELAADQAIAAIAPPPTARPVATVPVTTLPLASMNPATSDPAAARPTGGAAAEPDPTDVFFLPARAGDTLETLYRRVYRDRHRRPSFARFVAANPGLALRQRLPSGRLVAFPGPIGPD